MPDRLTVDVGVVTWNTAELTVTALRRLLDSDQGCDIRLLVHDNGSADGTPDAVAELVPEADLEAGDANLGFGPAMNRLIARSGAAWFLALNPDAWPEPGAVGRLVAAGESRPRAGAVAPRLLRPDDSLEHSTHPFPSVGVAALDAVGGRRWLPRALLDRLALEGSWDHDRARAVDWAVGAALLLRRRTLDEVGGFDESYFMYAEDLDWCWRARRSGWEIRFEPAAVVRHVGNASGATGYGWDRIAAETRSAHRFLTRTRGPVRAWSYEAVSAVAAGERWAGARLRRDHHDAERWARQVRAHLSAGRPAPRPS
ncbi:MAG TPA: glycosyltransferase family 2 protein [Acidimicrobiales bacterium]|nr:glycosyltransferase family 2 protein [Acidimicrobiales bacterium]